MEKSFSSIRRVEYVYNYSYDDTLYHKPYIAKITSWPIGDKYPTLEYGVSIVSVNNRVILKLEPVYERDIIEIGQLQKGFGRENARKIEYFKIAFERENKYTLLRTTEQRVRELFKRKSSPKDNLWIDPFDKKEPSLNYYSFEKEYMSNWNMPKANTFDSFYEKAAKEVIKDFNIPKGILFSKNNSSEIMNKIELNLGKELKECVQELINITGEIIATGKPCSDKVYKVFKRLEVINKQKEEIKLIRAIEI